MKKKIVSWETPPKEGEPFVLFTENNRMVVLNDIQDLNRRENDLLRGEKIAGWLPVHKDNQFPGVGFPVK